MYVKQNDASRLIHMMTQLDISYSIWGVRVQIANFRGEIGNLGGKLAIWGAKELIRNLGFLAAIWKGPNCRVFHRLSLFRLLCTRVLLTNQLMFTRNTGSVVPLDRVLRLRLETEVCVERMLN
jgi:hypothetical protein